MKTEFGSLLAVMSLLVGIRQAEAQGVTVFPIATTGVASQAGIFAAFGVTNYLVGVQGDGTTNSTAISAQLISTNGALIGSRILPGRTGGIPYVGFGGTNFLLVWSDNALVAAGGNDQVYGQFVTQTGALAGSPFTFGPTSEEQDMQGGGGSLLAFDGKNYLAVWDTGGFHDSSGGDVHGALFSQSGALAIPIIAVTSQGTEALTPAVAFGKTNYLVVWNNRRASGPEEYDIYGEFISTNGTQGNAFVISQTPTPSYDPLCASFDGTNFMVVWSKNVGSVSPNTIWNLYGRVVSPVGTFPGSEIAMVTDTNNPEEPSLAFDGANYVLAWNVGVESITSQTVFQFFGPAGSSIGPEFNVFSPQGLNAPLGGGLLFDGNRFEITAVVGGITAIASEGADFSAGSGTFGAFLSTNVAAPAYTVTTNADGATLTITGYSGPPWNVIIPATIDGSPVTCIGNNAFEDLSNLSSVTIPSSITNIGNQAFYGCTSLTSVSVGNAVISIGEDAFENCSNLTTIYFDGNAPIADSSVFVNDNSATVYYLLGATGWGPAFGGVRTALWGTSVTFSYTITNGTLALSAYNGAITVTGFTSTGPGTVVTIPGEITNEPVTVIGEEAFRGSDLTGLSIPNSVTSIGDKAFYQCQGLTSITIPDSVTSLGTSVFDSCVNLGNATIGSSVTSMGEDLFQGCTLLTNATIDYGVTTIGARMFAACEALVNITIPDSVTSIEQGAFSSCESLTSVTIPTSVTNIGGASEDGAFEDCVGLTSVTIPNTVTSIGAYAFDYCENLDSVNIGTGVIAIGDYAFANCVGNTLIVSFASNAPGADLTVFAVTDNSGNVVGSESGVVYYFPDSAGWGSTFAGLPTSPVTFFYTTNADGATLTLTGFSGPGSFAIPSEINGLQVTGIGNDAFEGKADLTNVTIPVGVTSIGGLAFYACASLTSVTIPNTVTNIGMDAFLECPLTSVTIPNGSIGAGAFYGCSSLTNATIGDGVTNIGDEAFYGCSSLTSVIIPAGVISFGSAFEFCSRLTNVIISDDVTGIGSYAFYGCTNLASLIIPASVTTIGSYAFEYSGLGGVTIPNNVTNIEDYAFEGCARLTGVTIGNSLTNLATANGVTIIGISAFQNCTNLTNVMMGNDVANIGDNAFAGCYSLTGLTMGDGVTNIGFGAFGGDGALTDFTIGTNVAGIGQGAFSDCTNLSSVTIPNSVTSIGDDAFSGCHSLTNITIGEGVAYIGVGAFLDCESLTSVTIPNGVTSVEGAAFYDCANLTSVTIGNGVTYIGEHAFGDCGKLTSVYCLDNEPAITAYDVFTTYIGPVISDNATVYYVSGATGWGANFAGLPTVEVNANAIIFAANPTVGSLPLTVNFTSADVDIEGNAITNWTWAFGDGTTSTGQNPSHAYTAAGAFTCSLLATNSLGGTRLGFGPSLITVTNIPVPIGSLNVTISPPGVITAGARWQVDAGTSQTSGVTVTNLSVGVHTVSFTAIEGWITPLPLTVAVAANQTTTTNAAYVAVPFSIGTVSQSSGTSLTLSGFSALAGTTCYVLTSTNLALPLSRWMRVATDSFSTGGNFSFTVTNLFTAAARQRFYALEQSSECVSPPSGIVDWWPARSNALDVVGANNGTPVGAVSYAPGKVGLAFSFGAAAGYVALPADFFPYPTTGTGNQPFTFEVWFDTSSGGVIFAQQQVLPETATSSSFDPGLYVGTDGKLRAEIFWNGSVSPMTSASAVNNGSFHHAAVTYDGTNAILYLDGVGIATNLQSQAAYASAYNYQFGTGFTEGWPGGNGGWYQFNGLIDEPSIYNRALSSNEIASIYAAGSNGKCETLPPEIIVQPQDQSVNLGSNALFSVDANGTTPLYYQWQKDGANLTDGGNFMGSATANLQLNPTTANDAGSYTVLVTNAYGSVVSAVATLTLSVCVPPPSNIVAWWPANGNAVDVVGGNNGTLVGGVGYAPGEVAEAFDFGGVNGYVSVPNAPALNFTNGLTIEGWIELNNLNTYYFIACKQPSGTAGDNYAGNYEFQISPTSGYLQLVHQTGTGDNYVYYQSTLAVSTGIWHHVAVTLVSGGSVNFYLDGQPAGTSPQQGAFGITNSQPLLIGTRADFYSYFNGLIDELSLYSRALSSNEVSSIYMAGSSGKCTNQ